MRQDKRAAPKAPINENISAREVRLIGADGEQIGIVSIDEALRIAEEAKLDLVEISADAVPPVCRVMDYGKSIFEKKKQVAAAKKNQKQIQVKEIKFRPGTEEGDYQVKLRNLVRFLSDGDRAKVSLRFRGRVLRNLVRFLSDGDRAKVSLRFRGREMAHQELGMELLKRVEGDLLEYGSVEQHPKMEGRQLIMVIAPKKKK
ncbi:translation initiation factor IF-3 [Pseudomonas viridiflava ICMP 13104]|uniref:Translation initiation factor IF-3 n=2 Tax=Pseudomonas TaxID=286 RepID=A0A0W0HFS3_PSEVI|nr:translation initiation factor IF-3 [Pseudomonas viridiflava ICMP 13104]